MPVAKTVTLAQAKATQQTAEAKATQPTPPKPEPTEEELIKEEQRTMRALEEQDDDEDPDEKAARLTREKTQEENQKEKKRKSSTSRKNIGLKKRKCEDCHITIQPKDPRTKFCIPCAKKRFHDSKSEGGKKHGYKQEDIEEKLRPFLRIGLNLKEACLEAEVNYGTIVEKQNQWENFREFIERHRNYSLIKAKRNIFANLSAKDKETVATSKWLLERQRPNEYGQKVDITGTINHMEQLSPEKHAMLAALLAHRDS